MVLSTATRRRRQTAAVSAAVSPGTDRALTVWRASVAVYPSRAEWTPTAELRRPPTWRVYEAGVPASPVTLPYLIAPVACDVLATTARYLSYNLLVVFLAERCNLR